MDMFAAFCSCPDDIYCHPKTLSLKITSKGDMFQIL